MAAMQFVSQKMSDSPQFLNGVQVALTCVHTCIHFLLWCFSFDMLYGTLCMMLYVHELKQPNSGFLSVVSPFSMDSDPLLQKHAHKLYCVTMKR